MRFAVLTALGLFASVAAFSAENTPAAPKLINKPSPEFEVKLPYGGPMLLSSLRGKVVALEFLYTTCPHCQHASQVFTQLFKEYGPRGFQPVGVAFNPMSNMLVSDFTRDYHVGYPVGWSEREKVLEYLGISPIERFVVPQIVWIDRHGNIRSMTPPLGDEEQLKEPYWRNMIENLLREPAATAKKVAAVRHGAHAPATHSR